MNDDRVFATAKMNRSLNWKGESELSPVTQFKKVYKTKKVNYRKIVTPLYVLLLLLDWLVVLLANIIEVVSNSVNTLALHLETYINNANKFPSEPET